MPLYAAIKDGAIVSRRHIDHWDSYPEHKKSATDADGHPTLRLVEDAGAPAWDSDLQTCVIADDVQPAKVVVTYTVEWLPLDHVKSVLRQRVDRNAERVRLRYITEGGVGMALTYTEKKDQAVAVFGMGEAAANALTNHGAAEFPTLSASVPIEAPSLYAAAQLVISRYEAWAALSRHIETARLGGKKSISDASDAASAKAAYEAIAWPSSS